jgi:hypothetical protein
MKHSDVQKNQMLKGLRLSISYTITGTLVQSLEANLNEHKNSHLFCCGDRGVDKTVAMQYGHESRIRVVFVHAIGKRIEDAPWMEK